MISLKHLSTLIVISLFSLFLFNCEKIEPGEEIILDVQPDIASSQLKAAEVSSSSEINCLLVLIATIKTYYADGLLNQGNANALISKIENAIKSLEKRNKKSKGEKKSASILESASSNDNGNENSAKGPLNAFINQVDALINSSRLPIEEGEIMIKAAENVIISLDGSFYDERDGNEYSVVLIGEQLWMAENLKATKFNDGTDIPQVTEIANWASSTSPAYCWYNNDYDRYGTIYGALYNWHVVGTGKLCPEGWHVPTIEEWAILADYLGGYSVSGGILKETGTTHWLSPNTEATNESEFTALPSGIRYTWGGFSCIHSHCYWWTSSLYFTSTDAHCLALTWLDGSLWPQTGILNIGMAVRCIKD